MFFHLTSLTCLLVPQRKSTSSQTPQEILGATIVGRNAGDHISEALEVAADENEHFFGRWFCISKISTEEQKPRNMGRRGGIDMNVYGASTKKQSAESYIIFVGLLSTCEGFPAKSTIIWIFDTTN